MGRWPGQPSDNTLTPGYAGSQFINATGVQEYLPPPYNCSYVPNYNYARYVAAYAQLVQVFRLGAASDNSLLKTYAGLVRDPGTCQFYGESTIVTDWENKVVMYSLVQTIAIPGYAMIKVESFAEFYQWQRLSLMTKAQVQALEVVPPALKCHGQKSYCSIFYQPFVNQMWNGTLNY